MKKAVLHLASLAALAMLAALGCNDNSGDGQHPNDPDIGAFLDYFYCKASGNCDNDTAGGGTPTTPTGGTFVDDRDGTEYKIVTIGSKVWMAENLNYNASGSVCYDGSAANCAKYGRLYNWNTAMGGANSSSANPSGVGGVCPAGWHLPSDAEWTELENAVGGSSTAGTKLKSTSGWYNDGNGTDEYGFSALPGGYGISDGSLGYAGYYGYWWSATQIDASYAWYRLMYYDNGNVDRSLNDKTILFSVRCVQDP